ncbi:MAG: type 1 glutamine amidotransferase domain-containing protein [Rickettsiales bacterium]|nr:type 1 glutamine amidotransferase domain-containing protein [Rickettsiales bacterium]
MKTDRILFVVTSANHMGTAPEATGSWLEEIAGPYYAFLDAKCDVTIASPKGGLAPIDPTSLKPENLTASTRRFDADGKAQMAIKNTVPLEAVEMTEYDAVFFAGGHGTMEDFPTDAHVKSVIEAFYAAGKPVSAVCHGPACFVNANKPNGEAMIKGHRYSCFTDEEEVIAGLEKAVPFMLESRLTAQGGIITRAKAFAANVVVDGELITGQNPASAIPVAEAVIHELRARAKQSSAA